jgi:glycosyltransferase involved in cell wall biosynthesis
MPALNEGKTIFDVLSSIPTKILSYDDVRLLVVNDGSIDNTESEALRAKAEVINHKKNSGLGVAFQTAVNFALKTNAEVMVSIDADGQFDTGQIEMMVCPIIANKADFCIGNRFSAQKPANMPGIKFWGNKRVNKLLSFLSNETIQDASCGFRAYSKECLINLNLHGKFTYTHEVILDLLFKGFYMQQIPIKVSYFDGRKSRVASNLTSYGTKSLKIMLKSLRDYKPFYFFGMIALLFFIISALSGLFVFIHWMYTGYITPYKSIGITSLILFLVSVLFLVLALLADMLGRIRKNQEKILSLLKSQNYGEK